MNTNELEVVLEMGAEGGSITLNRWEASPGDSLWEMVTNEVVLHDLLDGEDGFDSRDAIKHRSAHSFEKALKLLDRYSWHRLRPIQVHAQYRVAILLAVFERGGAEAETRWRRLTERSPRTPTTMR